MFALVKNVLRLLERALDQLDPERLGREASLQMFECFCRIERLGAAGKALCSRRVAGSNAWIDTCERSPAHLVASVAGTTVGRAAAVLDTADLLQNLPATEAAYRKGKLSEPQVEEIASAAALDKQSEAELLLAAELEQLVELRRRCARVRATARSELERHEYLHRHRQLRHWTDVEGAFPLDGRFTPEAGAVIWAALEPFKQRAALRNPNKEPDAAYAADALVAMAKRSSCSSGDPLRTGPEAVVHVRVDYAALVRGQTNPGEICEVPGVGPIPVAAAQAFAADAFIKAVLMDGEDIRAVSHLGRSIPDRLKTALIERDPVCVVPGCCETEGLEFDHIIPVERRGPTSLHNLGRLCQWHHYLKTYFGYVLGRTRGEWYFHGPNGPPVDPRSRQLVLTSH
ncbi:MAG: DUF222 domain-containing protein [Actinomycetota bacterium]